MTVGETDEFCRRMMGIIRLLGDAELMYRNTENMQDVQVTLGHAADFVRDLLSYTAGEGKA